MLILIVRLGVVAAGAMAVAAIVVVARGPLALDAYVPETAVPGIVARGDLILAEQVSAGALSEGDVVLFRESAAADRMVERIAAVTREDGAVLISFESLEPQFEVPPEIARVRHTIPLLGRLVEIARGGSGRALILLLPVLALPAYLALALLRAVGRRAVAGTASSDRGRGGSRDRATIDTLATSRRISDELSTQSLAIETAHAELTATTGSLLALHERQQAALETLRGNVEGRLEPLLASAKELRSELRASRRGAERESANDSRAAFRRERERRVAAVESTIERIRATLDGYTAVESGASEAMLAPFEADLLALEAIDRRQRHILDRIRADADSPEFEAAMGAFEERVLALEQLTHHGAADAEAIHTALAPLLARAMAGGSDRLGDSRFLRALQRGVTPVADGAVSASGAERDLGAGESVSPRGDVSGQHAADEAHESGDPSAGPDPVESSTSSGGRTPSSAA